MSMNLVYAGCLLGLCWLPATTTADVINFQDLGPGVEVTGQYGSAIFSTIDGQQNLVHYYSGSGNILCTAEGGVINCLKPTFVDFPNPVNNLTFLAIEPNEYGVVATISVFQDGIHTVDVDLIGLSARPGDTARGNKVVDLSGYSNITRIEINGPGGTGSLDDAYAGNGIGWDDFSFSVVPTPGVLGLAAASLLALPRRRT